MFCGLPHPNQLCFGPAGALPDFTVPQTTSFTWKDMGLLTVMPTAPEPTGANTMAASTSILPAGAGDQERDTALLANLEPGSPNREKTTHPPSETTPHPTTHRASTTRATTAQAPVTLHSFRDMQPDHHKTSAPEGLGPLDPHPADPHTTVTEERGPSVTERTAEAGTATQFPKGEGSGEEVSASPCGLCASRDGGCPVGLAAPIDWLSTGLGAGTVVGCLAYPAPCALSTSHCPP